MEHYELRAGSMEQSVIFSLSSLLQAPHAVRPIIPLFQYSIVPIAERSGAKFKLTVHFNQKKVQGWFTAIKNPGLQKKTGFFIPLWS